MDWYWTRSSIRSSVPSGKKNKHFSSARRITSRRRWCDRILETERWSSEQIWVLSILVWWCMEEQDDRRRRQQEKISILYWSVRTRNSLHSSSSRSFRTQDHSSYTSVQCVNSERFLRVHLSYWFAVNLHSKKSGLTAGGQNSSRERQTVFSAAVIPMHKNHKDQQELDLTKPRLASCKQKLKRHQDTVCWVDIQIAQRKGLKTYQTRPNVIIFYDSLPACCISKAIVMESEEIIYQKVFVSRRPPPKISLKHNWMCDLDSDIAGSSKDTQRIEPKPKTLWSSTRRPICGERKSRNVPSLTATLRIKRNMMMSQTQQVRWDRVWSRIHKTLRVDT